MTADPLTPAWIASRLTEPQRQALLWLPGDGDSIGWSEEHERGLWALDSFRLAEDIYAYLAKESPVTGWRATPLSLAVRAVVAGEAGAP